MKKNLLSIIILSLLVVNIILTVVMMLSVIKTNSATAELVTDIAGVLELELNKDGGEAPSVSLADTEVYTIPDSMTITLKREDGDTQDHYCIVKVSLMLNSANEDYAKYSATISSHDSMFKGIIVEVIGSHTLEEVRDDTENVRNEILDSIREMYDGSEFVYKVNFTNVMYQ